MTREPNPRVIHAQHPSSEWHTPEWLRAIAHEVLGDIALDPATDNRNRLGARRYFTRAENGLSQEWFPSDVPAGPVWLNPPYGRGIAAWTSMWLFTAGYFVTPHLALLPARVGARWYRSITTSVQLVCELNGRVRFDLPDGTPAPEHARWGNVLCYCGPDRARVKRILDPRGAVRFVVPLPSESRKIAREVRALERRGQMRLVE